MMKFRFLFATAVVILTALESSGQACTTVLSDNFATSSGWTSVGNGDVNVSSGVCNFNNAFAGADNRVYKTLPTTLSNTYWKAECKVTFNGQNPSGNGAGAELLNITAGTLPFMTYDASQGYLETTQDGISVLITSSSATDENRDNWFFLTEAKLGNTRTYSLPAAIYASSVINTYYLRLERTSQGMTQMSVCTDAAFTQHMPGSPTQFAINPAISGLNVIQHAANVPGTSNRMFNGSIDDDYVCHDGSIGMEDLLSTTMMDATVLPNPASTTIRISPLTGNQNVNYSVFGLDGALVQSGILNPEGALDISSLTPGSYLLVFTQDDRIFRTKFVKTD